MYDNLGTECYNYNKYTIENIRIQSNYMCKKPEKWVLHISYKKSWKSIRISDKAVLILNRNLQDPRIFYYLKYHKFSKTTVKSIHFHKIKVYISFLDYQKWVEIISK